MEKIMPWSERLKGARDILIKLKDIGYLQTSDAPKFSKAEKVICSAVVKLMLDDKTNIDKFLKEYPIEFYDWEKDKKGKPIKCKARFKL